MRTLYWLHHMTYYMRFNSITNYLGNYREFLTKETGCSLSGRLYSIEIASPLQLNSDGFRLPSALTGHYRTSLVMNTMTVLQGDIHR